MGANVTILNRDLCVPQGIFGNVNMFCVGPIDGTPCSGDSGGPLVCGVGTAARLAGIASTGPVVCHKTHATYTPIALYRKWITNITGI